MTIFTILVPELAGEEIFARPTTAQLFGQLVPEFGRERSIGRQLHRHTSPRVATFRLSYLVADRCTTHSSFRRISERAERRTERDTSYHSFRFEAAQFRFIIIAYQPAPLTFSVDHHRRRAKQ